MIPFFGVVHAEVGRGLEFPVVERWGTVRIVQRGQRGEVATPPFIIVCCLPVLGRDPTPLTVPACVFGLPVCRTASRPKYRFRALHATVRYDAAGRNLSPSAPTGGLGLHPATTFLIRHGSVAFGTEQVGTVGETEREQVRDAGERFAKGPAVPGAPHKVRFTPFSQPIGGGYDVRRLGHHVTE